MRPYYADIPPPGVSVPVSAYSQTTPTYAQAASGSTLPPWKRKPGVGAAGTPSYISVAAPAAAPDLRSNQFPNSMKKYLGRAFARCPPEHQDELKQELLVFCKTVIAANRVNTIDWENYPLPTLCEQTPAQPPPPPKTPSPPPYPQARDNDMSVSATVPVKRKRLNQMVDAWKQVNEEKLRKSRREERFRDSLANPITPITLDEPMSLETIVGTCQILEKNYFRLTSAPDPSTVRPLPVLRKTFALLRDKAASGATYNYLCDQYKSIRQDLTVQRILNDFTVQVYEEHARQALKNKDLGEYNQCQTQLKQLYAAGIPGCVNEFVAYRILYALHTRNQTYLNATISELTPEQRSDAVIRHALRVRSASASHNYHLLFLLFQRVPNLGQLLIVHFLERERVLALMTLCKSYRPRLSASFVRQELGFQDKREFDQFCQDHNLGDIESVDAKQLLFVLEDLWQSKFTKVDIKGQV